MFILYLYLCSEGVFIVNYSAVTNEVLIQVPKSEEDITRGGVIIPGEYRPLPTQGIVIAVGSFYTPGGVEVSPEISVGDMVIFPERAVAEVDAREGIYSIKQWHVLAIVPPAGECRVGGPTGRTAAH